MLAQGTPLHVVSEILGHASIVITKDMYGHLVEGDKRSAAELMSQALFGGQLCPWLPGWLPESTQKAPPRFRKGPLSWARSEGLEPPTF